MIIRGNPHWRSKPAAGVAEFVVSGFTDSLHNADRLTVAFREGIIASYSDEDGKVSLIRNPSALSANHTMSLVDRHRDITAPTQGLWDVHDLWQTIADGERLAREGPNATLKGVEAGSYWLQMDKLEVIAQ